ncbi:hypothetical protein CAEBREN_30018 [Caenorhabditis brenneri]|uniref:NTF2 domain-containing protein n=1 Tax=Caenorhabditis brenneri TaxID=135651 RepID=G0PH33_CAEBE|nr:hypothetical protein CAEBREN_30018 [Caenorhabditis brenneri]
MMRGQFRRGFPRRQEHANGKYPSLPSRSSPAAGLKPIEVEAIRSVVDSRYNAKKNLLDLSNFSNNQEFIDKDMLMCLTKARVLSAVIHYIGLKYPSVAKISLSISTEEGLEKMGKMSLEEIIFEGNPVCDRFHQVSEYVIFIQKTFPTCSNLDGLAVKPKQKTIDVKDLIPFRNGYYGSEDIRTLVEEFIIAYYKIYDGVDGQQTRKTLLDAYEATKSTFTLTITCLWDPSKYAMYPDSECYRMYLRNSHNVLNQEFFAANRAARISHGAMDIAVALSRLPATIHLLDTFVVDVFLISAELLGFTVHGTFRDGNLVDRNANETTDNYFTRTFMVAPKGEGKWLLSLISYSSAPCRKDAMRLIAI